MKTRICPLCDQPMKKAHRCDSCNSFIWKPMYIDIHYNTNGAMEQDCSYDTIEHDYSYHDDGSVTMMPEEDRHLPKRHPKIEKRETPEFRGAYGSDKTEWRRPAGKGRLIAVITVAFTLFSLLPGLITGIGSLIDEFDIGVKTPETREADDALFSDDNDTDNGYAEMTEFTDEEVIARGEECTGESHLDVVWENFRPLMEQGLEGFGADITDYSDDSQNYAYFYGSDDSRTYYIQSRMYHLKGDIGSYFNVSWDTVSGRLHEVSYDVSAGETAEDFFVAAMTSLTGDGESFRDMFAEQRAVAEEDEYVFCYTDEYEVYISYDAESYDGEVSYYISITKAM